MISKHRQFDADTGEWIEGKVRIFPNSSLRKRMRAASRGKMPSEVERVIIEAENHAALRRPMYLNSCPSKWQFKAAVRGLKKARAA